MFSFHPTYCGRALKAQRFFAKALLLGFGAEKSVDYRLVFA
jgi:hypothetical protein